MSFSSDVKLELCRIPEKKDCCELAELAAFMRGCGSLRIGRGGPSLVMTTEIPAVARRIFSLCKRMFSLAPEVRTQMRKRLGKSHIYHVVLGPGAQVEEILQQTGLTRVSDAGMRIVRQIPASLIRKTCCKHAYLRGAFIASGTLADPGKGYHMEFVSPDEEYAKSLCQLLIRMEIPAKVVLRRELFVVYLKESEYIVECLNRMGAHSALLEVENIRIAKSMRNNVNRVNNCDNANVDRTVSAAQKQMEAIARIENTIGLSGLPRSLRLMAEARMENPDATLVELGETLIPPVSKSAVNHRLRKLVEIAQEIAEQKGEIQL